MSISPSTSYTDIHKRETKSHGNTQFPAACYQVDFPENHIALHWHQELELIYILSGDVLLKVGNQQFRLSEGNGAFINRDILHTAETISSNQHSRLRSIVFHPTLVGGLDTSIYWTKYLNPIMASYEYGFQLLDSKVDWQQTIIDKIALAWNNLANDLEGYEFNVRNELSDIIFHLFAHMKLDETELGKKKQRSDERLKTMLMYLQQHYYEEVRLEDIADSASVSKSEALRCFKDILGESPIKYLNHYRLHRAAQLIKETSWRIAEVAEACGYKDMAYFSYQFKREYDRTPTEYRSMYPS